MSDVATFCDECSEDIAYEETCHAVTTGQAQDGTMVVRIVCAACYAKAAT